MRRVDEDAVDALMTRAVNLKQEWIDTGFPGSIAGRIKKELHALPAGLSGIHRHFLESIRYDVDQGEVHNAELEGRSILPVRNCCTDIPGHITCFREHNGLIHGGIRHASGYTLTCRAFRLEYTHTGDKVERNHVVAIVAGVCEQKDGSGKTRFVWSTAQRLKNYYSSTSAELPTSSFRFIRAGEFIGHYAPLMWPLEVAQAKFRPGTEVKDSGQPALTPGISLRIISFGGSPNMNMWANPPHYNTAVENVLYNHKPGCTDGFPICTPYITVFAPDPQIKETIVSMVGAFREQYSKGYLPAPHYSYKRNAEWYCKTFS